MNVDYGVGDLVRLGADGPVMRVMSCGVKSLESDTMTGVLCSWTDKKLRYEWIFDCDKLQFVSKERRLIPRLLHLAS